MMHTEPENKLTKLFFQHDMLLQYIFLFHTNNKFC